MEVRSAGGGAVLSGFDLPAGTHDLAGWSPDGRWLVTTAKQLLVWEGATGRLAAEYRAGPRRSFTDATFHPSAPFLLAAADDGTVRLYRTDTWEEAERYAWGFAKAKSVAVAPDGMRAAAGGDEGRVVVWDLDL
jgi:WD40 repeat protein